MYVCYTVVEYAYLCNRLQTKIITFIIIIFITIIIIITRGVVMLLCSIFFLGGGLGISGGVGARCQFFLSVLSYVLTLCTLYLNINFGQGIFFHIMGQCYESCAYVPVSSDAHYYCCCFCSYYFITIIISIIISKYCLRLTL